MLRMNPASMGEMPPSTRRSRGLSVCTASEASLTISAYVFQPGSISKFQCDRLLGSFHSITASITAQSPSTEVNLLFRPVENLKPGAAQHGFQAGAVGNPPVRWIVAVPLLDEVQRRIARSRKDIGFAERIILFERLDIRAAAQQGLRHKEVPYHVLVQQIQRQQRMPEVVEDAQKQHQIKLLPERADLVHRHPAELNRRARNFRDESRLLQISFVGIDAKHARGAAPLHLDRIESRVAADIEHGFPSEIRRDRMRELLPFERRVISQKMMRRGFHAAEIHVLKPLAKLSDAAPDLFLGPGTHAGTLRSDSIASRYPSSVPTSL